ncbi:MAG: SoxR reducing system RseC family protein [Paludibacteraceae bacterium]|nr:SoxR reducing system RseC family protein [Paludibacteraceae bacterium]
MSQVIHHKGIVESIDGTNVRVRIVQASACSICSAKGGCMAAESKEKTVDAVLLSGQVQTGDEVRVSLAQKMGWKAITVAYVLPFMVLMAVIVLMHIYGKSDGIAGVAAVCAVGVYYIGLSLFRNYFKRDFQFVVSKE